MLAGVLCLEDDGTAAPVLRATVEFVQQRLAAVDGFADLSGDRATGADGDAVLPVRVQAAAGPAPPKGAKTFHGGPGKGDPNAGGGAGARR